MKSPINDFAKALRYVRKSRGLQQEHFDLISSRTYISALERSIKHPTISKVDSLAEVLGVHPLALLTLCYVREPSVTEARRLLSSVLLEVEELVLASKRNEASASGDRAST
jgi:transcriptional regulator with XRE-family HTH domain